MRMETTCNAIPTARTITLPDGRVSAVADVTMIGACDACGSTVRIRATRRRFFSVHRITGAKTLDRITIIPVDGDAYVGEMVPVCRTDGAAADVLCRCRARVIVETVRARVTDHECGAACRSAKGHVCDCTCGGEFHGADA